MCIDNPKGTLRNRNEAGVKVKKSGINVITLFLPFAILTYGQNHTICCHRLDGMIAGEKGEVDWLNDYMQPGEDYGTAAFFDSADLAIMGSKTYEQTLAFNY